MPDKGKVMSQTYYEKENKLLKLYKEFFDRKEMDKTEAIAALRIIGFSNSIAARRVNEWTMQCNNYESETEAAKKRRIKQQASLEKYILYTRLGKKFYINLKTKYKNKELTKDEVVLILMQSKHSKELSEITVKKWKTSKNWKERRSKTP